MHDVDGIGQDKDYTMLHQFIQIIPGDALTAFAIKSDSVFMQR